MDKSNDQKAPIPELSAQDFQAVEAQKAGPGPDGSALFEELVQSARQGAPAGTAGAQPEPYKDLVGKTFVRPGQESVTEAKDTSFSAKDLPLGHRIFDKDNQVATMDYCADRLNIHLDDNDRCTKVSLG
ncbi:hypothetical protein GGF46_005395 [Coemansia sp. RSA 552]|nr:hypothetical protein GGF46_005395 [Coemansia sp. RSA 552]